MSTNKVPTSSHTHTHTTQHRIKHASVEQTFSPHTIHNRKTVQNKNRTLPKPHSVVYKIKTPTPTQRNKRKNAIIFLRSNK